MKIIDFDCTEFVRSCYAAKEGAEDHHLSRGARREGATKHCSPYPLRRREDLKERPKEILHRRSPPGQGNGLWSQNHGWKTRWEFRSCKKAAGCGKNGPVKMKENSSRQ